MVASRCLLEELPDVLAQMGDFRVPRRSCKVPWGADLLAPDAGGYTCQAATIQTMTRASMAQSEGSACNRRSLVR
jgi:hypothetical protein